MPANRGTEAYDLSLFEPKPAKIVQLKKNKKALKQQQRKNAIQSFLNTAATLCVAALVVTVLGLIIGSRAQLATLNKAINDRETRLVELQSEKTRLTDELARKTSTQNVEEYAKNVLGMQKVDSNQIEYIYTENTDKVVMADPQNGSILDKIVSSVSKFFSQVAYLLE